MTEDLICSNCKKPIYEGEALFCHFCGEGLHRTSSGLCGNIKYGRFKALLVIVIVLILLIFLFFMSR